MTLGWDDSAYVVWNSNRSMAVGPSRSLLIGYDKERELDATICNVSKTNGEVCRLPLGHDGLHVPFSGELIAVSGVYVVGDGSEG